MVQQTFRIEPLKCWNEAKELRSKYYHDYLNAGFRCSGSGITFPSFLEGLGRDVVLLTGEPYAATISYFTEFSDKCMEAVEAAGFARDLCSYMRNYWGSIILNKFIIPDGTILDEWPKPDLLFTGHFCCSHAKWYQIASEFEGGVPLYGVDYSIDCFTELKSNDRRLDYVVQQYMDSIEWLEKISGRKFDDELFIEAMHNECRSLSLWAEICTYNKAIPAPLDEKTMYSLYVFNVICPHRKEVVAFYERLRDEVKDRVERGVAAVPTERFRFITDGQPPWAFLDIFRYMEREYGAVSLGSIYTHGLIAAWDEDEEGNLVPAKTPQEKGIKITNREEAIRALADFRLKGWLITIGIYSASRRSDVLKKLVRQWNADAVIFHLNRGCEAFALGQMENRLDLLEDNIRVLTYEGSMGDNRDFDMPATVSAIDSFMESLGVSRLIG